MPRAVTFVTVQHHNYFKVKTFLNWWWLGTALSQNLSLKMLLYNQSSSLEQSSTADGTSSEDAIFWFITKGTLSLKVIES